MKEKIYSLIFCVALCLINIPINAADSCNNVTRTQTVSPGSFNRLDISYPTSQYNFITTYSVVQSSQLQVVLSGCSDVMDTVDSSLAPGANSILLSVTNNSTNQHTINAGSRASSTANPILLMLSVIATLFLFPRSRMSVGLIVIVFSVALYSPMIKAAGPATVNLNIGVPAGQTWTICQNSVCMTYPNNPTNTPTNAPTNAPNVLPTATVAPNGPTVAPTAAPPTVAPTATPTGMAATYVSSVTPASALSFNLRILILAKSATATGVDFAKLVFQTVGTPTDVVAVAATTTDLTPYLSLTGTGLYSGILVVGNTLLSAAQTSTVTAYQAMYGVKMIVIASTGAGLPGITFGTEVTNTLFNLTLAPQFAKYAKPVNPAISVANNYIINWESAQYATLYPGTVTNPSIVTPAIMATGSSGVSFVAAAAVNVSGSLQLHYFVQQSTTLLHSMIFHTLMVDWIAPGGLFVGARRMTFTVQPDDLFLGSYIWDIPTHSNPVLPTSPFYRITADDLQQLADFFDSLNARLPTGSYLTVEWPTNFGGVNNAYYTNNQPDYLYMKAQQIRDKFYYLSHTWDHPCDFDNITSNSYNEMWGELQKNINFTVNFFPNGMSDSYWSNASMITPCVTGLYNGQVLQAMWDSGIRACVSDESVTKGTVDFEAVVAYHGVYSNVGTNGFAGMFFVPRMALDIDYCDEDLDEFLDEYNYPLDEPALNPQATIQQAMQVQTLYAIQLLTAFRQDPYMMHQTNAKAFSFNGRNISLVSYWMELVVDELLTYYTLPINIVQMDNLAQIFRDRTQLDNSTITVTLSANANQQITGISLTAQQSCVIPISGGLLMNTAKSITTSGTETTSFVNVQAGVNQYFALATPLNIVT